MQQHEKLSRVMESDTISKNGRSSKSQTSRKTFINKIKTTCNVLLIIGLSFLMVSCSTVAMVGGEVKSHDTTNTSDASASAAASTSDAE